VRDRVRMLRTVLVSRLHGQWNGGPKSDSHCALCCEGTFSSRVAYSTVTFLSILRYIVLFIATVLHQFSMSRDRAFDLRDGLLSEKT
jgi:hypothetical protein